MTTRLFIKNLPPTVREEDLDQMFSMYGKVQYLYLSGEWESPSGSRFAFVDMDNERYAQHAVNGINNMLLGGRTINVVWSRSELKQAC